MAQVIEQSDTFGKIGKAFGEGLSEQLPKEMERYRLSQGLKRLQENPDMDEIERLRILYSSGASDSQIAQIDPYLRNAKIRNSQKKNAPQQDNISNIPATQQEGTLGGFANAVANAQGGGQGQPVSPTPRATQQEVRPITGGKEDIIQPGPEDLERTVHVKPVHNQIDQKARELMAEQPEIYNGPNAYPSAYATAEKILSEPYEKAQEVLKAGERQEQQKTKLANTFKGKTEFKVGKTGENLFDVIPREAFQRAEKRVEFQVANGKSIERATEEESDLMRDMSKKLITLRNNIDSRPFFGKASTQMRSDIKNMQSFFEKNGEQELFKDELKLNLDIGDHLASYEAYPVRKDMQELLLKHAKDDPEKLAAVLGANLKDNDSLFALGYLMDKMGIDDQSVINQMNQYSQDGLIKTNSRQNNEGSAYYPLQPDLDDTWYEQIFGISGTPIKMVWNYITGRKEKVGPVERIKRSFGKE